MWGGSQPEESVLKMLGPGARIFDVGANVGDFSHLALEIVPDATVYAFEPNPNCERYLRALPIEYCAAAAGRENGRGTLYFTEGPCELGSLHKRDLGSIGYEGDPHGKGRAEVRIVALDDFADLEPHLVKIDAEGCEQEILEGATSLRPQRWLFEHASEWQFVDGHRPSLPRIFELLEGYTLWYWRGWTSEDPDQGWEKLAHDAGGMMMCLAVKK